MNAQVSPSKGKDFWGPPVWRTIHIFAASFRPQHSQAFLNFAYSLEELLPCEECRAHLKENLKVLPPEKYLSNNHTLFFWSYALHDMVNQQHNLHSKGKKKRSPPYDEVKNDYFKALVGDCKVCEI
jgi:hypothetical protein